MKEGKEEEEEYIEEEIGGGVFYETEDDETSSNVSRDEKDRELYRFKQDLLGEDLLSVPLKPKKVEYHANIYSEHVPVNNSKLFKDQLILSDKAFCDMSNEDFAERQKKLQQRRGRSNSVSTQQAQTEAKENELKKKMDLHEEDMHVMTDIINYAKKEEQKLLQKTGTITKAEREAKRRDERKRTSKMLSDVKKRHQKPATPITTDLQKHATWIPQTNKKRKWIEESKKKGRDNYKEHLWAQKMEELALQSRLNHEKTVQNYKLQIDQLNAENQQSQNQLKIDKASLLKAEEEIKSLKYTIEILRQKLSKQQSREIEKEQKLKLFSDYEPLFESLQKDFNFGSPQEVIKRMEILEKARDDSYVQYMETEEQLTSLGRQFEKYKKETEIKHRQAITDLEKQLERAHKQCKECNQSLKSLQQTLTQTESYRQKFLTLSDAVTDLWHTWMKDIETTGNRDVSSPKSTNNNITTNTIAASTLVMFDEPDHGDSKQIMLALKNLLIAFTPNKAGQYYTELARMANGYWLRYFKENQNIKSKPKKIFEMLGQYIDSKNARIHELENKLKELENNAGKLKSTMEKAVRDKKAVESQLNVAKQFPKRPQSSSAISGGRVVNESRVPSISNMKSPTTNYNEKQNSSRTLHSSRPKTNLFKDNATVKRPSSAPSTKLTKTSSRTSVYSTSSTSHNNKPINTVKPVGEIKEESSFFITQTSHEI